MSVAIRVVLDVFSGRPNPEWMLSTAEVETLVGKAERLSAGSTPGAATTLGYRGFEVHRADLASPRPWLRIRDGRVTVEEERGPHTYEDSEGIESWLQDLARRRGMDALIRRGPAAQLER